MKVFVSVCLSLSLYFTCHVVKGDHTCPQDFPCLRPSECRHLKENGETVLYPCKHGEYICCPTLEQENHEKTTNRNLFTSATLNPNNTHGYIPLSIDKPNNHQNNYNQENEKKTDDSKSYSKLNINSSERYTDLRVDNEYASNGFQSNKNSLTQKQSGNTKEKIRFNIPDTGNGDDEYSRATTYPDIKTNISRIETNEREYLGNGNREIGPSDSENELIIKRREPFQKNCGISVANDKITGGQVAEIGQFPWMALLGFRQSATRNTQFLCGGSLITTRHVLTAAHCIIENRPLELVLVRLGEYNLTTQRDCVKFGNGQVCADDHVDVLVERVFIHPNYNRRKLKNDIALIKLDRRVRETEYIRTICLPFDQDLSKLDFTDQNFTVSGWGKSQSGNLFGSDILQFAKVTTWNHQKCNSSIPSEVRPLSSTQLCANGRNSEDACKGDSGGPLINTTLDKDAEIRHIQYGIVSFGTATCGDRNLPTIYTRVDKYLQWIVENVT